MIRRPPRSTLFPYTSSSDLLKDHSWHDLSFDLSAEDTETILNCRIKVSQTWVPSLETKADDSRELGIGDRKSTRLNSSHSQISYAVFCLKKKKMNMRCVVID